MQPEMRETTAIVRVCNKIHYEMVHRHSKNLVSELFLDNDRKTKWRENSMCQML